MAFKLFQKFIAAIAPTGFRGFNGVNYLQSVFGLPGNMNAEAARLATKAPWCKSDEQPGDAVVLVGQERILPQLATEPVPSYRARLADAWNTWETAGNPVMLEDMLAAGGYPLTVYERHEWPTRPPVPYWSIFWLLDSTNSIPASPPATYGSGVKYGTPGVYYGMTGPQNLPQIIGSICLAVRKARPAHIILGSIIVPGTAPLYGTGVTYGSGATYGGTSSIVINC